MEFTLDIIPPTVTTQKGYRFDLAPSPMACEVPPECGLKITGAKEVTLEHVNTRTWRIIQKECV